MQVAEEPAHGIVMLARDGKPPLRLRARLIRRVVLAGPDMHETWLEIWGRPGGRAAAAFAWHEADDVRQHAVTADSLHQLIVWLENMAVTHGCAGTPRAASPNRRRGTRPAATAALERLSERLDEAQARRRFALLLDEALSPRPTTCG